MSSAKKYRTARSKAARSIWHKTGAKAAIGAGLILLGIVLGLVLMNQPPTSENARSVVPAPVSFPAPELTLSRLDGQAESLDDYLGQVVLINNWATWCPPCKAEMPDLQAYYVEHKDQGFSVVAISAADAENDVRTFVEQYQLSFPVWLDPQNQALSAFRNQSLPSSYVVDRTGTVRLAWTGVISRDMLEEYLTPLLEE